MEKRKEKRLKKRLLANVSAHSAVTCDISATGLQVAMGSTPKTVLVDMEIDLDKQPYQLKGKIKWIRKNPIKKTTTIGISLQDVPKEYKSKLKDLFPLLAVDDETEVEIAEINEIFGI